MLILFAGCGEEEQRRKSLAANAIPALDADAVASFAWPEKPSEIAILEIRGHGTIKIGLYSQLAPKTVAHIKKLAAKGVYDQTQFHRVIEGFMIQGGDPHTKPKDDPSLSMRSFGDLTAPDEFNAAHHDRGVVSMANRGRPNTAGSQFFIVHQESPHLDGAYTAFGRVIEGIEVVDAIAVLEIDKFGRFGPKDRPLDPPVIAGIRFETPQ